jgi:lipoprotein-anchoring transpeptidase ErfK/SrfK
MYRALPDEEFPIPAVDLAKLAPRHYRQVVDYATPEEVGTVIVDPANRYLYHVQADGKAMRYGVGVGKAGFEWSGRAHVAYGRKWSVWTPPRDMIERQPSVGRWRHGQPPGIDNPLGARALYIHQGNQDTLYRLHGTGEVRTIGKSVSSGCVRLLHQDIIDLYDRVRPGSALVVLP